MSILFSNTKDYVFNNSGKSVLKKFATEKVIEFKYIQNININKKTIDPIEISSRNFAIRKLFYLVDDRCIYLTDNVKELLQKKIKPKIRKSHLALYSLLYHFVNGKTAFSNIFYLKPNESIILGDTGIEVYKTGTLSQMLYNSGATTIDEIALSLMYIIKKNIDTILGDRISLSLTGGADTRNLLSVFLNLGVKPHLYTYGNPFSADCEKAKMIADGLGLSHSIHDIKMDCNLFEKYAKKIIALSGGMASIHRVHRLMAVEREKEFSDYMFLGTLGGEFVKGVSEDDYIIPAIVYENWKSKLSIEKLDSYLERKRLLLSHEEKVSLLEEINELPFMTGSVVERKLDALTYITAHLHDAQDINLYETIMEKVFTPFLDLGYLKLLFSSKYSFDKKESIKNKRLKRIENPFFAAEFLQEMYPPLLKFEYSGEHRPDEVLINKYYATIMKVIRKKIKRRRYPPNFPLGQWMVDFVKKNLPICMDYPILRETFDIEKLIKDLSQETHQNKESYWLKFTNPIQMRFIIEEFGGN